MSLFRPKVWLIRLLKHERLVKGAVSANVDIESAPMALDILSAHDICL